MKKVDRHVIGPHEYDEIPELTDEMAERASRIGVALKSHMTRKKAAAKTPSRGKTAGKKRVG